MHILIFYYYVYRRGNCVPFRGREKYSVCDDLYVSGVDYVFVPFSRYDGNFDLLMDNLVFVSDTYAKIFANCMAPIRQMLCHYALPPCGNSSMFKPPTSVCVEACTEIKKLCPFESGAIHCSNIQVTVEDYPFAHCCSNIGVNITLTGGTYYVTTQKKTFIYALLLQNYH